MTLRAADAAQEICAHSGKPVVRQRSEDDCMLCVLAMFLGQSYEAVDAAAVAIHPAFSSMTTPMPHSLMRRIAHEAGFVLLSSIYMDWASPGIVGVLSRTQENCGHALFWDGEKLIDPGDSVLYDRAYVDSHGLEFTQRAGDLRALIALEASLPVSLGPIVLEEFF